MEALTLEKLENIEGGGWKDFVDGACFVYQAPFVGWLLKGAKFTPLGTAVAVGELACLGWSLYRR